MDPILGLRLGPLEAAVFWLGFLRGSEKRGLKDIRLVISDAHEGLKAAIAHVFRATCRDAASTSCAMLSLRAEGSAPDGRRRHQDGVHTGRSRRGMKAWRQVADQLRARIPKLAAMIDEAEADVIAYLAFPESHWPKLHSTDPIERLNKEVKRRTDVVGIFSNEAFITRLVGAILLEQDDRR